MCISVFPPCMHVYHVCTVPMEDRAGVIGRCEPLYGCQKLNFSLLQEQQVLLTSESSLQLQGPGFVFQHQCMKLVAQVYNPSTVVTGQVGPWGCWASQQAELANSRS